MWPALRRIFSLLIAGLVLAIIPADAQIRPDTQYFRWSTRRVTIKIKPSDYDLLQMTATVTIPRAITGHVRPRAPWHMSVRADPFFAWKRGGMTQKPCNTMAIRWSDNPSTSEFLPLTPVDMPIAAGDDNGVQGNQRVDFDLKFAAHTEDLAGDYTIELYFVYSGSPGSLSFP